MTVRLRAALTAALAARDRTAVSALRSALAAIGNAEAVSVPAASRPSSSSVHVAGAAAGLGSAEAPRRALTDAQVGQILRAEITDRIAAAQQYDELGRADQAARLRSEAFVVQAALDGEVEHR